MKVSPEQVHEDAEWAIDEMLKGTLAEMGIDEAHLGFEKLERSIAQEPGVRNPAAVTASIGRKKYGNAKMQNAAAHHHAVHETAPLGSLRRRWA